MTRKMIVREKSGFRITNPQIPVVIRDCRGILFYTTEYQLPRVVQFNLPSGEYIVDSGSFVRMNNPVNYPLKKLPPPERHRKVPNDFKIIWGDNPNKCSVIWPRKVILFDRSLEEYRLPDLYLILYHEYSHASYRTEKYCDLKAYNYMIMKGYNPAQIGMSLIDSLSDQQHERKQFLVNVITNKKYNK